MLVSSVTTSYDLRAQLQATAGVQEQLQTAMFELISVADRVVKHEGEHGVTWMGLLTNKVAAARDALAEAVKEAGE